MNPLTVQWEGKWFGEHVVQLFKSLEMALMYMFKFWTGDEILTSLLSSCSSYKFVLFSVSHFKSKRIWMPYKEFNLVFYCKVCNFTVAVQGFVEPEG